MIAKEIVAEKIVVTNAQIHNLTVNTVNAVSANIEQLAVGSGQFTNLVASNITIAGKTIEQFVDERIKTILTTNYSPIATRLISPVIETTDLIATGSADIAKLQTNEIKPKNGDLTIDLSSPSNTPNPPTPANVTGEESSPLQENPGELARLMIKGLEGKTVATIDSVGNATLSGTLAAKEVISQQLAVGNASISGTLAAQTVSSRQLAVNDASVSGTLVAKNIQSENINSLTTNYQSLSTNINDIQKLLADIKNQPLPNVSNTTNLSGLGYPSEIGQQSAVSSNQSAVGSEQSAIQQFNTSTSLSASNLTITGSANLYTASVADSLLVGNLLIKNDSILSLAWELKLSALSTINLFDGAVVIAKNGNITTTGEVVAKGGVRTNEINAINAGDDITVKLKNRSVIPSVSEGSNVSQTSDSSPAERGQNDTYNSKLKIENSIGDEVASIDASGSATFKSLALEKFTSATGSASIIAAPDNFVKNGIFAPAIETASETAGVGLLPSNQNEVIIYNDSVKTDSLIYLTPTTSSSQQLTVSKKESCALVGAGRDLLIDDAPIGDSPVGHVNASETCRPYFKISTPTNNHDEIKFNWLIIN